MQSCSRFFRSFKQQGHSFSALQYFCRRCKVMTQTEYVPGNVTPCNTLLLTRQVSSWEDSSPRKVKKLKNRKRNISRASVLSALAGQEDVYMGTGNLGDKEENKKPARKFSEFISDDLSMKQRYTTFKKQKEVSSVLSKDEVLKTVPDSVKKRTEHKSGLSQDLNSEVQSKNQMSPSPALKKFCADLKVMFDNEASFSASIAFHHLCEVTDEGTSLYGDGKHAAVIDELLDLVHQTIVTTENDLVKDFVIYNFKVNGFPPSLFRVTSNKFKFSMNSNKYTMLELLDISAKLQSFDTSHFDALKCEQFESLLTSIWDLISLRENKITYSELAQFYKGAPVTHKKIFSTLQSALSTWLYEQNIQDVLDILNVQQQTMQAEKLMLISEWIKSTLEVRSVEELEKLLTGYLQCEHVCPVMLENLPNIANLADSKSNMTTNLICQIVSYCKNGLCRNRSLLKMACNHYVDNTKDYTTENLHTLLHAIGVLNFVPDSPSPRLFFSTVEDYLIENFYNIDVSILLEMFVYLLYVDKVAINFASYIFSPSFLGIVFELEEEKRMKAVQNLELLLNVFRLRGFKHSGLMSDVHHPKPRSNHQSSTNKATNIVTDALYNIVGRGETVRLVRRPTSMMEQYIELDYMELAQWAGVDVPATRGKFIILPVSEESFCRSTKKMIGPERTNVRILTEQCHTVVEMHLDTIEELASTNQLSTFLKSLLMEQVLEIQGITDDMLDETEDVL